MTRAHKAKSVIWAAENVQHIINFTLASYKLGRPLHHGQPTNPKSILRKSPQTFPQTLPASSSRETTPEPSSPSEDATYLANPVNTIVNGSDPMSSIIEAYNQLCIRLKAMHQAIGTMDSANPLPALAPIIDMKDRFIVALDRDIRRALANPRQGPNENKPPSSPVSSPKKGGMSDEEATEARDMHLTCLAALKCSNLLLSSEQLESLFSTAQLLQLITSVLSIPLAEEMPSLNSRKTYAIAVGVLAASILPQPVAEQASSRITFALRRAIEGELGREGKKGSIADGLKAVRDLVNQHPKTFIPEFTAILPGLFLQLTGASKINRYLAANALGALAIVSHEANPDCFRRELDSTLGEAYQTLLKELRSALTPDNVDAPWALSTLAAIVTVTHGSPRAVKLAMNVLPVAMQHKKTGIKMMGTLVWRCYAQEALLKGMREGDHAWQLLMQVLPNNVGLGIVAALTFEGKNEQAFKVLDKMIKKGGASCAEAVPMLQRIMSFDLELNDDDIPGLARYVPSELFDGTLLYNPYSNIGSVLQSVMKGTIDLQAIRPFKKEFICSQWKKLLQIWKDAASRAEVGADGEMPKDLAEIWRLLLASRVEDNDCVYDELDLQTAIVDVLDHFLTNPELVWTSSAPDPLCADSLKFGFITNIWSIARESIPATCLEDPAMRFLPRILEIRPTEDSVASWAELSAHLTALAPSQQCLQVLDYIKTRTAKQCNEIRSIWNTLMSAWTSADGSWEDGLAILSFPCRSGGLDSYQDLESQVWEECMRISFMKAQGANIPLESIISGFVELTTSEDWHIFMPRFTELIFSHVCITKETMTSLADLTVHTLGGAYDKAQTCAEVLLKTKWLLREITRQTENIKSEYLISFLEGIQTGLMPWVRDEKSILNKNDYSFEIGNFFESILTSITGVDGFRASNVITLLAPLFASAFEGAELGHSREACVEPLTAFFECVCIGVPIPAWPPVFLPRLRELSAFTGLMKEYDLSQSREKLKRSQVLFEIKSIAGPVAGPSTLEPYMTPRKRRYSEPDAPSMKKRKRVKIADENISPSPLTKSSPRRSLSARKPLVPVEIIGVDADEEQCSPSPLETPTKPKRRKSLDGKGERLTMDCVRLPTLALYEKEQGITGGSQIHQTLSEAIAASQKSAKKLTVEQWPNSDDTLVDGDFSSQKHNDKLSNDGLHIAPVYSQYFVSH